MGEPGAPTELPHVYLGGSFVECSRCHCAVPNTDTARDAHEQWHEVFAQFVGRAS